MPSDTIYQRLAGLEVFGARLGLERITTLLACLGSPQDAYPSILIAGTNGKGSVGAMVSAILTGLGVKTGYYTSPHLVDPTERIAIDQTAVTRAEFEEALSAVFDAVDRLRGRSELDEAPTYFETMTAAAFWHFRKAGVQAAVVEVGLGGRFDATNVLHQKVSVITTIGLDHQEVLGKTIPDIAAEKAGIIQPGSLVITGPLPAEAAAVVREKATACATPAVVEIGAGSLKNLTLIDGFPVFDYPPWNRRVRVNLRGRHQAQNAAVALAAVEGLAERAGMTVDRDAAVATLDRIYWPGRLDVLQSQPLILVDSAHNPMGVRSVADFLREMGFHKSTGLFTAMRDKQIEPMLTEMAPLLDELFLTRVPPLQRCAPREQLDDACRSVGLPASFHYSDDPAEALDRARSHAATRRQPLIVFGSMYLVGTIFRLVQKKP